VNPHYADVAARAEHRCEYCHAPEVVFNSRFEIEHVIPSSREGSDVLENWALACRSCNLWKAAHTTATDPESQTEHRLFSPREDLWTDHFRVALEKGTVEGLTLIGKATVSQLRMNSDRQVAARRQWMRLGLFP